jgi:phosphomannose isomerase type I-like protein
MRVGRLHNHSLSRPTSYRSFRMCASFPLRASKALLHESTLCCFDIMRCLTYVADLYPDANHKPELALALTRFEALSGFRTAAAVGAFANQVPSLARLVRLTRT